MSDVFSVTLRATGSKKNTYRTAGKRVFQSFKGKRHIGSIKADIEAEMYKHPRVWPLPPPYGVQIFVPMKHRTDLDNAAGHPLDCLQACGVIRNDRDVWQISIIRTNDADIRLVVRSMEAK